MGSRVQSGFLSAVASRRTFYQLSNKSPISNKEIQEIIATAMNNVPSSFNSQTTRVIVLLKDEHQKLWDIVKSVLHKHLADREEQWKATETKLNGFRAGYGTVLFYNDPKPTKALQEMAPNYATKFPGWAVESNAMHQFTIWTALEEVGFGANLQHYHPVIDEDVAKAWDVPEDWQLQAQLVFGQPTASPGARSSIPIEEKMRVYGA